MEAILAIRRLLLAELAIHSMELEGPGGLMEDLLDQMEGLEVPMEDFGGQTLLMEVQVQVLEEVGGSTLLMEVQVLEDPKGLVQLVEDQVLEDPLGQMEV